MAGKVRERSPAVGRGGPAPPLRAPPAAPASAKPREISAPPPAPLPALARAAPFLSLAHAGKMVGAASEPGGDGMGLGPHGRRPSLPRWDAK